jgi:hypothetical protein
MSGHLVKYDAACRALAEAKAVDEVKDVRDVAMAMKLYAKQAKNRDLEADAFELRVRAERRLGEMMASQNLKPGNPQWVSEKPITLSEVGIDKNLADRARKLIAIPSVKFEEMVKDGRDQVHRSAEKRVTRQVGIDETRAAL